LASRDELCRRSRNRGGGAQIRDTTIVEKAIARECVVGLVLDAATLPVLNLGDAAGGGASRGGADDASEGTLGHDRSSSNCLPSSGNEAYGSVATATKVDALLVLSEGQLAVLVTLPIHTGELLSAHGSDKAISSQHEPKHRTR
jgi:hypothetical protein